jgi:2-polyprenyl-6-hydroxyphenyl methylase/3-demethylubiquinone-9 3-methyltransferase
MAKSPKITFEEFQTMCTNLTNSGEFSFGYNWLDYVNTRIDENIISTHVIDLKNTYDHFNFDLDQKTVLDIGCGSGLSSLSFARLGCKKILSLDVDPFSVQATKLIKSKFFANKTIDWEIEQASILDEIALPNELFDIVYSWGVLHHTGDMWTAIRNAIKLVKPSGILHLALYMSGNQYTDHLEEKFRYKFANRDQKIKQLYERRGGKGLFKIGPRGMNKFHNSIDWLGGLPYEVVDPEVLEGWLSDKYNFKQLLHSPKDQGGCFTSIFQKR